MAEGPRGFLSVSWSSLTRGILLFWAAWFAIAALTNIADLLVASAVLSADWPFASGNYELIATLTNRYPRPAWMVAVLLVGAIGWESAAALLFARAFAAWPQTDAARRLARARAAYAVALALWASFLLIDEVLIAYDMEATHLRLFIAHLVCAAAAHVDPDRSVI